MNGVVLQLATVIVLLTFSLCGLPQRRKVEDRPVPVTPVTPIDTLTEKVAPVAEALAGADDVDRAIWASVWERAALVAEGDIGVPQPIMVKTSELRLFTIGCMDVAWNRLRKATPGKYPQLATAIEAFLADPAVLGKDDVILDDAFRNQYAAACRVLAYAGRKRG